MVAWVVGINMGGFSMIRTGRTKIDSKKKMEMSLQNCKALDLDALVVIGGDDSNTNAAFLAQYFTTSGIKVIPDLFTASFFVNTDQTNAQIASVPKPSPRCLGCVKTFPTAATLEISE